MCWSIWRRLTGPAKPNCPDFQRFPRGPGQFGDEIIQNLRYQNTFIAQWPSRQHASAAPAVFTFCCACSTALPLPGHVVRRSRLSLTGVLSWKDVALGGETERAVRLCRIRG